MFAAPASRRADLLLLGSLGLVTGLSLLVVLSFGPGRDQGIYAIVARTMLEGGMPYREAWDFKPPGIFLVYAVARGLFGAAPWGVRALEAIGLLWMGLGMIRLAHRWWGQWRVGLLAATLAILTHAQLDFWHTAQPESFGGMLIVAALCAGTRGAPRAASAPWLVASGVLFGAAGLLKPPLAGAGAVFALWAAFERARLGAREPGGDEAASGAAPGGSRSALLGRLLGWLGRAWLAPVGVLLGGVLPFAACLAWFGARGALDELWDTLFVFTPHYTAIGWRDSSLLTLSYYALGEWLVDYSGLMLAGLAGALVAVGAGLRPTGAWLLAGIVGIQLVGVGMQAKFFPYHFGAIWPATAMLAALGWWWLAERAWARGPHARAALALLLVVAASARTATKDLGTSFWGRLAQRGAVFVRGPADQARIDDLASVADVDTGANRAVAALLREAVPPERSVYIWGFEPVIYDFAARRSASRYIYDVPQRVAWAAETTRAQLMTELAADPPAAIVVAHHDVFPMVTGDALDSAAALASFPALATLLAERYEWRARIEDFDVYLER